MCGIAGIITTRSDISKESISLMIDKLVHRGPDGEGLYLSDDARVGFGHRRLAIIDLSDDGNQPMSNEDQSIWLTYNGEIYNHNELRRELKSRGHIFSSKTDTEVIVHAYEEWGVNCVEHFNGMFAFAIYDESKKRIFLARDRFGIKPLHYARLANGDFIFASEIKALTAYKYFNKDIDWVAVAEYFKYRYIPGPRSIWKDVKKLQHGSVASYDIVNNELEISKYYDIANVVQEANESSIDDVYEHIYDAIKLRLIADVEVGSFLSGGLDSSVITSIAHSYNSSIKSFSVGFEPIDMSELPYSEEVANYLGTEHITDLLNGIPENYSKKLAYTYDEPMADSSCIPTYLLSQMTSKHVKVALSGDGGDEIFSGYNWYNKYREKHCGIISSIKGFFQKNSCFESNYNKILLDRFNNNELQKLFSDDIYESMTKCDTRIMERYYDSRFKQVRPLQYVDLNTFMVDDILTKVDRASMAHSLEVRVPFLDHNLVESVLKLPESIYPSNSVGKPILKQFAIDKVPQTIIERSKKGFSAPMEKWNQFEMMYNSIIESSLIKNGILNRSYIDQLHRGEHSNSKAMIWMIFHFQTWWRQWNES